MKLFVDMGSGPSGPFTVEQVVQLIRTGMVNAQTPVSSGPNQPAAPAFKIREFAEFFGPAPNIPQQVVAPRQAHPAAVYGMIAAAILLSGTIIWVYVRSATANPARPYPQVYSDSPNHVDTPPPRPPTLVDRLGKASLLADALPILRPLFTDTVDKIDPGAALLATWAAVHMIWADLNSVEETTRAKVLKDPESERSKRLCTSGTIAEISVDRSVTFPLAAGGIVTAALGAVRFLAVRSTGALVESSPARICGIVTGRHSYSNTIGGTTHSVFVVGMFDLPENRKSPAAN